MNKYKLLALDMDGTLLNSKKKISDETARWLTRLSETGVKIALCTGRNIAEIREYDEQLTGVRYAILNSGLSILGYEPQVQQLIKGIVFLIFVALTIDRKALKVIK